MARVSLGCVTRTKTGGSDLICPNVRVGRIHIMRERQTPLGPHAHRWLRTRVSAHNGPTHCPSGQIVPRCQTASPLGRERSSNPASGPQRFDSFADVLCRGRQPQGTPRILVDPWPLARPPRPRSCRSGTGSKVGVERTNSHT